MPKADCNKTIINAIIAKLITVDLIIVKSQRKSNQETNKAAINKIKFIGILLTSSNTVF